MIKPAGTPPGLLGLVLSTNVGITSGGGAVNVGNLVGMIGVVKAAIKVGSRVAVVLGVGVGGGSMIGKKPGVNETSGA